MLSKLSDTDATFIRLKYVTHRKMIEAFFKRFNTNSADIINIPAPKQLLMMDQFLKEELQ